LPVAICMTDKFEIPISSSILVAIGRPLEMKKQAACQLFKCFYVLT